MASSNQNPNVKEIPSPSSICVKSPSIIRTVSSPGRMIWLRKSAAVLRQHWRNSLTSTALPLLTNFLIQLDRGNLYETNRQHRLHHRRGHRYWPWPRRRTAQARQQSNHLRPSQRTSRRDNQGESGNGFRRDGYFESGEYRCVDEKANR